MITSTPATVEEHAPRRPLDGAIATFLTQLQTAGYATESVRNKRTVVRRFADWLQQRAIPVDAIDESHIGAKLSGRRGHDPSAHRTSTPRCPVS